MKKQYRRNIDEYADRQVIEIVKEIVDPARNERAKKDVSRRGILVGELFRELRKKQGKLPKFTRDNGLSMKPKRWSDTTQRLKIFFCALVLTNKNFVQLNVNFSDKVIAAAENSDRGFAPYIQQRMTRLLKREFGEAPDFWFCIEAKQKKLGRARIHEDMDSALIKKRVMDNFNKRLSRVKAMTGGIKPSRPHLHGAIEIPECFVQNKEQGRKALKEILLKLAGTDYDKTLMGPPVKLKKPDNLSGWATYYAVINDAVTEKKIGGKPYGSTRKIKADARLMYSEVRDMIIDRGIEGKILRASDLLQEID